MTSLSMEMKKIHVTDSFETVHASSTTHLCPIQSWDTGQAPEGNKAGTVYDNTIFRGQEKQLPQFYMWSLKSDRHASESQLCDYGLCDLG